MSAVLLERLLLVRQQGYAVSDGENSYGLRTVAAPLFSSDGSPCAGVSLTIAEERMSIDAFVEHALPDTLRVARKLTRAIELTRCRLARCTGDGGSAADVVMDLKLRDKALLVTGGSRGSSRPRAHELRSVGAIRRGWKQRKRRCAQQRLSDAISREMWEKWILLAALGAITCLMRGLRPTIAAKPKPVLGGGHVAGLVRSQRLFDGC